MTIVLKQNRSGQWIWVSGTIFESTDPARDERKKIVNQAMIWWTKAANWSPFNEEEEEAEDDVGGNQGPVLQNS